MTSLPTDFSDAVLECGRRVLKLEASALEALSGSLDGEFVRAVELILSTKGRVIVSGMGKSGHVASKITATLASTGTPAQFVHPGEASHGDLGMITAADVVVLLSNSGETPELADIIAYVKRHRIPLIGVAGREGSTLLTQADIKLLLPKAAEACPNGLAPTTSTTMTLALGDALAVALMEQRQFTPENFRNFHPGGKLGARLVTVGALMHADLPVSRIGDPMSDALLTISAKGFGVTGVTDEGGKLIGVITDGDLRRNMDGLLAKSAGDVMTLGPKTIGTTALASEALAEMQDRKITCLFVVDEGLAPIGILHIHDCLRAGVG